MPLKSPLKKSSLDLIKLSLQGNSKFSEFCNEHPDKLGTKGSKLRRLCQQTRDNLSRKPEFQSPEKNRAKEGVSQKEDRKIESTMSSNEKFTEAWANKNCDEIFTLDPEGVEGNVGIQCYIANQVYIDNNTVSKLVVHMAVEDWADYTNKKYEGRLEKSGKGLFITTPRFPKYWKSSAKLLYKKSGRQSNQNYLAHQGKSGLILKAEKDDASLSKRIVYYKFPNGMVCDNSFFNAVGRDDCLLKTHLETVFRRELPEALQEIVNAEYQTILRIGWACVIKETKIQIEDGDDSGDDEYDDLKSMMNALNMEESDDEGDGNMAEG